jgi:hypothetical protein
MSNRISGPRSGQLSAASEPSDAFAGVKWQSSPAVKTDDPRTLHLAVRSTVKEFSEISFGVSRATGTTYLQLRDPGKATEKGGLLQVRVGDQVLPPLQVPAGTDLRAATHALRSHVTREGFGAQSNGAGHLRIGPPTPRGGPISWPGNM